MFARARRERASRFPFKVRASERVFHSLSLVAARWREKERGHRREESEQRGTTPPPPLLPPPRGRRRLAFPSLSTPPLLAFALFSFSLSRRAHTARTEKRRGAMNECICFNFRTLLLEKRGEERRFFRFFFFLFFPKKATADKPYNSLQSFLTASFAWPLLRGAREKERVGGLEKWGKGERERERKRRRRWRRTKKKFHRRSLFSLSLAFGRPSFSSLSTPTSTHSLSLSDNPKNLPQNCPASPLAKNTNENL